MSFLDNVKRREQENYRISTWWQAARQLYIFIRQHLRRAETASSLTVNADLIRLNNVFFDRIRIFFNGETVTVTPLAVTDSRTPERGGCIVIQSTNGVTYNLLWDGKSARPQEGHWKLIRADEHARPNVLKISSLTVSVGVDGTDALALSDTSFDEALNVLFGLAEHGDSANQKVILLQHKRHSR